MSIEPISSRHLLICFPQFPSRLVLFFYNPGINDSLASDFSWRWFKIPHKYRTLGPFISCQVIIQIGWSQEAKHPFFFFSVGVHLNLNQEKTGVFNQKESSRRIYTLFKLSNSSLLKYGNWSQRGYDIPRLTKLP